MWPFPRAGSAGSIPLESQRANCKVVFVPTVAGRDCGRCSLSWVAYPIDSYPFEVKGELYVRVTGGLSVFLPPPWFLSGVSTHLAGLTSVVVASFGLRAIRRVA